MEKVKNDKIILTRKELYDRVWTTAMRNLGPELGVSDVGLKKICKSFNIPTPPIGYWAKKEFGKAPKRPKLPKHDDPDFEGIIFYQNSKINKDKFTVKPESLPEFDKDITEILLKAHQLPPIKVPSRLTHPYPLVQLTMDGLNSCTYIERGMLRCVRHHGRYILNVIVSKKSLKRAMCIMHAVITRIEQLGGKVEVVDENRRGRATVVTLAGEKVAQLRLREKYDQVQIPKDPNKKYWYPRMDYVPNGMLIIDSGPSYFSSAYCRDTHKKYRLEDKLNAMIIGFVEKAGVCRINRRCEKELQIKREAEERERQRREEELQKKRNELQRRQEEEQNRLDELLCHVKAWRESHDIRSYLDAVKEVVKVRDGKLPETGEFIEYLNWAANQADRLDPLKPSPASILDENVDAIDVD